MVVETRDAILVANKEKSENIKNIVAQLKAKKIPESEVHKKVYRPWGFYETIIEENEWKVKKIHLKPMGKISLQMHFHRSEHWIVVSGSAKVEIDNKEFFLEKNQSIDVPVRSKHRLSNNNSQSPLEIIEIQSGSFLGEEDIKRFKDDYGRSLK